MPQQQGRADSHWPWFDHAPNRAIVLTGRKIVFVPMLKGGCTSMLWLLADLAGYDPAHFRRSLGKMVSPDMTVHDISLWRRRHRWSELNARRQSSIADDDGWLRFTTVRHPGTRIWSAWQSKLLMREPKYVARFGDEGWFPRIPATPEDVVADFRAFVRTLGWPADRRPADAHWAPQTRILAASPALNHIGKVEGMDDTVEVLKTHVGRVTFDKRQLRRDNSSMLPYDNALYDAETAAVVNTVFADCFEQFDYPPLDPAPSGALDAWKSAVTPVVPTIQGYVDRHERIAVLHESAAQANRLKKRNRRLRRRNRHMASLLEDQSGESARREGLVTDQTDHSQPDVGLGPVGPD